jgi:hypothetical protein
MPQAIHDHYHPEGGTKYPQPSHVKSAIGGEVKVVVWIKPANGEHLYLSTDVWTQVDGIWVKK